MITLKDLLEIDSRKFYQVIYCCSQYGPLFDSFEEAERMRDFVNIEVADCDSSVKSQIFEISGWQEEISEENAVSYIEAAMRVIKELRKELGEAQNVIDSLMDENSYLTDLIHEQ